MTRQATASITSKKTSLWLDQTPPCPGFMELLPARRHTVDGWWRILPEVLFLGFPLDARPSAASAAVGQRQTGWQIYRYRATRPCPRLISCVPLAKETCSPAPE